MIFSDEYLWRNENFTWSSKATNGSPIVITVPHDRGFHPNDLIGFLKPRERGATIWDMHVWPIVKDILLQVRINAVRGLFPRHFVDYNRPPKAIDHYPFSQGEMETAFDDESLRYIYDSYHRAIASLLTETIRIYGRKKCLLMDFHGFANQPSYGEYDLILGTGNRTTVRSNVDQLFADFFSKRDYHVFLPTRETKELQEDIYNGGFTVRHYAKIFTINAIQIEIAKKFRTHEGGGVGQKLSIDLSEFFTQYINSE
jgi:N-formylglutamate amidohydrolase